MNRPRLLIGVLGTHTEVGKTWVSVQLLRAAKDRALRVAARKPVQSYEASGGPTDAIQLAAATGEDPTSICRPARCYELAMAPPMAADCLTRPRITQAALMEELSWPANIDLGLLESVGGPRSPLAHDADSVEFITHVAPDRVLLVADAGLGSLNSIRLSLACLSELSVDVLLNRFDPTDRLHALNRTWLRDRYGIHPYVDVAELLDDYLASALHCR